MKFLFVYTGLLYIDLVMTSISFLVINGFYNGYTKESGIEWKKVKGVFCL